MTTSPLDMISCTLYRLSSDRFVILSVLCLSLPTRARDDEADTAAFTSTDPVPLQEDVSESSHLETVFDTWWSDRFQCPPLIFLCLFHCLNMSQSFKSYWTSQIFRLKKVSEISYSLKFFDVVFFQYSIYFKEKVGVVKRGYKFHATGIFVVDG